MKDRKRYIIYHNNCNDGFGAAYAAWMKFGDKATYIPVNPNSDAPDMDEDSYVYILDVIFEPYIIKILQRKMFKVVIIDHHQTNKEKLVGIKNCIFDMSKSGAVLAWEYFNKQLPVPKILKYVQDNDLWKKELPHTDEINTYIDFVGRDFDKWFALRKISKKDRIVEKGTLLLEYKKKLIDEILLHRRVVQLGEDDMIYAVNSSLFGSELGDAILKIHTGMDVSMCYYDAEDGNRRFSLRSNGNVDVAKIAEQYGGGGHPKAAGFTIKIGVDNSTPYRRIRGPYKKKGNLNEAEEIEENGETNENSTEKN